MANRVITVWSSKGGLTKYTTDVTTWGELKSLLRNDYSLSNMQATEMVNKGVLEHDEAVLPTTDFKLFFKPIKTKAGADYSTMGFKELRLVINEEGQELKTYLTELVKKEGRNWTQMKTPELQAGITSYFDSKKVEEVQEVGGINLADVVESVVQHKEEEIVEELTFTEEAETATQFFIDLLDNKDDEIRERAEFLVDDLQALLEIIKEKGISGNSSVEDTEEIARKAKAEAEARLKAEAEEAKAKEEARLKAEAEEKARAEREAFLKEEEELAREANSFFKGK